MDLRCAWDLWGIMLGTVSLILVPGDNLFVIQVPGDIATSPWGPDPDFYKFEVDLGCLPGPTLGSFCFFVFVVWGIKVTVWVPG